MMKSQPTNKTKIVLTTVLSVAALSGALYAFFFYAVDRKVGSAHEIFARVEELENEQSKHARLSSLVRSYTSDIERIEGRFVKESNIASFTKQLEDLGAQAGVGFSLESLEPSVGPKKESVLNVRLKATGDFAKVFHFAELIENFPVTELELSSMRLVRASEAAGVKTAAESGKTTLPQWELSVSATILNFVKE